MFIFHPLEKFLNWPPQTEPFRSPPIRSRLQAYVDQREFNLKTYLGIHFVDFKPGSWKISDWTTCFTTRKEVNSSIVIDLKIGFWLAVVTWLENAFGVIFDRLNIKRGQSFIGFSDWCSDVWLVSTWQYRLKREREWEQDWKPTFVSSKIFFFNDARGVGNPVSIKSSSGFNWPFFQRFIFLIFCCENKTLIGFCFRPIRNLVSKWTNENAASHGSYE